MTKAPAPVSGWERAARFMDEKRERLRRAPAALTAAGVPYVVVGGNAVAEWVGRADPAGVRNTKDVDLLLRRGDLDAATVALATAGFIHRHVAVHDIFLDRQKGKAREAVHVVFANESLRDDADSPAPDVTDSEPGVKFQVLRLEALVRMKLVANLLVVLPPLPGRAQADGFTGMVSVIGDLVARLASRRHDRAVVDRGAVFEDAPDLRWWRNSQPEPAA